MARAHYQQNDEDFEDGILKEGRSVKIPLHLMDATQRDVSTNNDRLSPPKRRVTDGSNDPLAMHRPGQRVLDGVKRDMRCYDEYDARKAREYLGADATGEMARGSRSQVTHVLFAQVAGKFGPEGSSRRHENDQRRAHLRCRTADARRCA